MTEDWVHVGSAYVLGRRPLQTVQVDGQAIALSFKDGVFGAIDGYCPHRWVLLGDGKLEGEEVVCPSHNWSFHRCSGRGDFTHAPAYAVKVVDGEVWISRLPS